VTSRNAVGGGRSYTAAGGRSTVVRHQVETLSYRPTRQSDDSSSCLSMFARSVSDLTKTINVTLRYVTYSLTHSAAIRSILVSRSHLPSVGRRPSVCHSVCVCLSHACYVLQRALCQLFLSAVSQLSCYSGWPHILPATRAAHLVATLRR